MPQRVSCVLCGLKQNQYQVEAVPGNRFLGCVRKPFVANAIGSCIQDIDGELFVVGFPRSVEFEE